MASVNLLENLPKNRSIYPYRIFFRQGGGGSKLSNFETTQFVSSNMSRLEAHVGYFKLLMKEIFGPYVLRPFDKKLIF